MKQLNGGGQGEYSTKRKEGNEYLSRNRVLGLGNIHELGDEGLLGSGVWRHDAGGGVGCKLQVDGTLRW